MQMPCILSLFIMLDVYFQHVKKVADVDFKALATVRQTCLHGLYAVVK